MTALTALNVNALHTSALRRRERAPRLSGRGGGASGKARGRHPTTVAAGVGGVDAAAADAAAAADSAAARLAEIDAGLPSLASSGPAAAANWVSDLSTTATEAAANAVATSQATEVPASSEAALAGLAQWKAAAADVGAFVADVKVPPLPPPLAAAAADLQAALGRANE